MSVVSNIQESPIDSTVQVLNSWTKESEKLTWKKVGVAALVVITGILPGLFFLYYQTRRFLNACKVIDYRYADVTKSCAGTKAVATMKSALRWGADISFSFFVKDFALSFSPLQRLANNDGTEIVKFLFSKLISKTSKEHLTENTEFAADTLLGLRDDTDEETSLAMEKILPKDTVTATIACLTQIKTQEGDRLVVQETRYVRLPASLSLDNKTTIQALLSGTPTGMDIRAFAHEGRRTMMIQDVRDNRKRDMVGTMSYYLGVRDNIEVWVPFPTQLLQGTENPIRMVYFQP